jgi:hypothetical protein
LLMQGGGELRPKPEVFSRSPLSGLKPLGDGSPLPRTGIEDGTWVGFALLTLKLRSSLRRFLRA